MTIGLQINNSWGTSLIDGTTLPYSFVEKGTVFGPSPDFDPITYTNSSLFAFRTDDSVDLTLRRQYKNVLNDNRRRYSITTAGSLIEWYRFESITPVASSGAGFQLYNQSSILQYSTASNPIVVRDVNFIDPNSYTTTSKTFNTGRKYAFIFSTVITYEGPGDYQGTNNKGQSIFSVPITRFYARDNNNGTVTFTKGTPISTLARDSSSINGTRLGSVLSVDITNL